MDALPMTDFTDYKVADISLAPFGRMEIDIAETEMPALMALRTKYDAQKPLANAKVMGLLLIFMIKKVNPLQHTIIVKVSVISLLRLSPVMAEKTLVPSAQLEPMKNGLL